jgi:hypothetical protein
MPEHVHLLLGDPESGTLATALQAMKQGVSRRLGSGDGKAFWQARYYDFNVFSERKRIEKLRYIHRNPVTRGLCADLRTGRGAASVTTSLARNAMSRSSPYGRPESENNWEASSPSKSKTPP